MLEKVQFQFLNGTIKRCIGTQVFPDLFTFQFLNGTIKRMKLNEFFKLLREFQFLNGTIKSFDAACVAAPC